MPKESKPFTQEAREEYLRSIDRTYVSDFESLFNWTKPGSYGSYSYEEFLAMVAEIRHLREIIVFAANAIEDNRDIEDKGANDLYQAYQKIIKCKNEIVNEKEKSRLEDERIKAKYNLK